MPPASKADRIFDIACCQPRENNAEPNGDGFRGPAWPAPSPSDILVFGDSQVFGLGVEDDQTFSAVLQEQLHAPVLNAGVPTYGPLEYTGLKPQFLEKMAANGVQLPVDFFRGAPW